MSEVEHIITQEDTTESKEASDSTMASGRIPIKPGSLVDIRLPLDVNLSPDGQRVAFVVSERISEKPRPRMRVWTVGTGDEEAEPLTKNMREAFAPRWSPDGKQIAFIGKAEGEKVKPQLYLMPAEHPVRTLSGHPLRGRGNEVITGDEVIRGNSEAKQVCTMPNGVGNLAWSPDGSRLSFLSLEGEEPASDPLVIQPGRHMRLWTVRPDYDTPEPVTPADLTVWEYTWSPDSRHIALYYSLGSGETDWYRGQIGVVSASGGAVRQITHLTRQASAITWTPDSTHITYISGEWSDRGLVGGDIFTVHLAGGEVRNLTPAAPVSYSCCRWFPDGQRLLYACWSGVTHQLGILNAIDGTVTLIDGNFTMGEPPYPRFSATANMRTIVTTHTTPQIAFDVFCGQLTDSDTATPSITWRRLTRLNLLMEEVMAIPQTQRISYASVGGWQIDAILTHPLNHSGDTLPPLIVNVHGGPSAAWVDGWGGFLTKLMASAGYAVLCANIRGSQGRGIAFSDAVLLDSGGKDFQDIMHGVDYLIEQGLVDANRVGIMGWSYGGYMTAWAITQTTRFKAAMMGAGVSDFHDFHALSNIPDWDMRILGTSPLEQPDIYRAHSAITYAGRVTTPTLILHGADDECVPVNQAYAMYRSLCERKVPTELVIYPREGHGPRERAHLVDMEERVLNWFKKYL